MILVVEIVLRLFFPQNLNITQLDEEKVFEHKPGIKSLLKRQEFRTTVEINSRGLRDKEYELEKPDNTIRIAVLGDSFTFGYGVEQNETFSKILETKLNSLSEINYEVINFGVSAYGTEQEYILMQNTVLEYSPDIILLGFVNNDLNGNLRHNLFDIKNGILVRNPTLEVTPSLKLRNYLSWHSHLYSLLYFSVIDNQKLRSFLIKVHILNAPFENPKEDINSLVHLNLDNKNFDYAINKTLLLFNNMEMIAKQHNTAFIILIIPYKEQVDDKRLEMYIKNKNLAKDNINMTKVNEIITHSLQDTGVLIIDPLEQFRKNNVDNTFYYNIDGHWNPIGHEFVAEILFQRLTEEGILAKS
tara:strand:- start:718 stop:1791 length:1074 start_codon:yes stop_codon:yes gene_type:complete